jgi:hypothetical protein
MSAPTPTTTTGESRHVVVVLAQRISLVLAAPLAVKGLAAVEVVSGCVYHLVAEHNYRINIEVGLVPDVVQPLRLGAPQRLPLLKGLKIHRGQSNGVAGLLSLRLGQIRKSFLDIL